VVLNTEVPGLEKLVVDGTEVDSYNQSSGGLIAFTVIGSAINGTPTMGYIWSDHYKIDVLDIIDDANFRLYPRLALINGTLWLTAWGSSGIDGLQNLAVRYYTSKNGKHWSLANVLPVEADFAGAAFVETYGIAGTVLILSMPLLRIWYFDLLQRCLLDNPLLLCN
jgi:hypothetical protein